MKVTELQEELEKRNLDGTGLKEHLITILLCNDALIHDTGNDTLVLTTNPEENETSHEDNEANM
eukprot:11434262-Ditylum_brightwellii.AAC.1